MYIHNIFVCTWYIHVHECKYMYGQTSLYSFTTTLLFPSGQISLALLVSLIWYVPCTCMYKHDMMCIHGIYKVIIYTYICCTWVLHIACICHYCITSLYSPCNMYLLCYSTGICHSVKTGYR